MAIREQIIIDVAIIDITDDYRVELNQERKRTIYSTQRARDLPLKLIEAAEKIDREIEDDMSARGLHLESDEFHSKSGDVGL